jgi:hypothetical protein
MGPTSKKNSFIFHIHPCTPSLKVILYNTINFIHETNFHGGELSTCGIMSEITKFLILEVWIGDAQTIF